MISLTSCVARVREKIVNKRLQEYLRKNDLLYKHQSGFLRNQAIHAAFLDLSKAYDRVSMPAALLHKLPAVGLSNMMRWLGSHLFS